MPLSSDDLIRRMLGVADSYAAAGELHNLDRLRIVAREYGDALKQLQRALAERERLLADLAALDTQLSRDVAVPPAFSRVDWEARR